MTSRSLQSRVVVTICWWWETLRSPLIHLTSYKSFLNQKKSISQGIIVLSAYGTFSHAPSRLSYLTGEILHDCRNQIMLGDVDAKVNQLSCHVFKSCDMNHDIHIWLGPVELVKTESEIMPFNSPLKSEVMFLKFRKSLCNKCLRCLQNVVRIESLNVSTHQRNRIKHENTFHNSKLINLKMNLVKKLFGRMRN